MGTIKFVQKKYEILNFISLILLFMNLNLFFNRDSQAMEESSLSSVLRTRGVVREKEMIRFFEDHDEFESGGDKRSYFSKRIKQLQKFSEKEGREGLTYWDLIKDDIVHFSKRLLSLFEVFYKKQMTSGGATWDGGIKRDHLKSLYYENLHSYDLYIRKEIFTPLIKKLIQSGCFPKEETSNFLEIPPYVLGYFHHHDNTYSPYVFPARKDIFVVTHILLGEDNLGWQPAFIFKGGQKITSPGLLISSKLEHRGLKNVMRIQKYLGSSGNYKILPQGITVPHHLRLSFPLFSFFDIYFKKEEKKGGDSLFIPFPESSMERRYVEILVLEQMVQDDELNGIEHCLEEIDYEPSFSLLEETVFSEGEWEQGHTRFLELPEDGAQASKPESSTSFIDAAAGAAVVDTEEDEGAEATLSLETESVRFTFKTREDLKKPLAYQRQALINFEKEALISEEQRQITETVAAGNIPGKSHKKSREKSHLKENVQEQVKPLTQEEAAKKEAEIQRRAEEIMRVKLDLTRKKYRRFLDVVKEGLKSLGISSKEMSFHTGGGSSHMKAKTSKGSFTIVRPHGGKQEGRFSIRRFSSFALDVIRKQLTELQKE